MLYKYFLPQILRGDCLLVKSIHYVGYSSHTYRNCEAEHKFGMLRLRKKRYTASVGMQKTFPQIYSTCFHQIANSFNLIKFFRISFLSLFFLRKSFLFRKNFCLIEILLKAKSFPRKHVFLVAVFLLVSFIACSL